VIDALWHLGVRDVSLPITSETVWRALREASREEGQLTHEREAV
jgi:RNAse (barnase) inhibitor barstar